MIKGCSVLGKVSSSLGECSSSGVLLRAGLGGVSHEYDGSYTVGISSSVTVNSLPEGLCRLQALVQGGKVASFEKCGAALTEAS